MTAPTANPADKLRPIVVVVWVALITAIVVTIIDWKIKQDILRISDTFYRTTGGLNSEPNPAGGGPSNSDPILPFPRVDSDTGVEAKNVPVNSDGEDHSGAWGIWSSVPHTIEPGTAEDTD